MNNFLKVTSFNIKKENIDVVVAGEDGGLFQFIKYKKAKESDHKGYLSNGDVILIKNEQSNEFLSVTA